MIQIHDFSVPTSFLSFSMTIGSSELKFKLELDLGGYFRFLGFGAPLCPLDRRIIEGSRCHSRSEQYLIVNFIFIVLRDYWEFRVEI